MNLATFFLYEVTPPLAYTVGFTMLANCFLMVLKARWQMKPHLGFCSRSVVLSAAMLLVALWLFIRGMTIFFLPVVNVNVILLSIFFLIWRSIDLRDYYQRSKANAKKISLKADHRAL